MFFLVRKKPKFFAFVATQEVFQLFCQMSNVRVSWNILKEIFLFLRKKTLLFNTLGHWAKNCQLLFDKFSTWFGKLFYVFARTFWKKHILWKKMVILSFVQFFEAIPKRSLLWRVCELWLVRVKRNILKEIPFIERKNFLWYFTDTEQKTFGIVSETVRRGKNCNLRVKNIVFRQKVFFEKFLLSFSGHFRPGKNVPAGCEKYLREIFGWKILFFLQQYRTLSEKLPAFVKIFQQARQNCILHLSRNIWGKKEGSSVCESFTLVLWKVYNVLPSTCFGHYRKKTPTFC